MKFNPGASKQAEEIIFSKKVSKPFHPDVYFNNNPVTSTSIHKNLGMILDSKLSFEEHLKSSLGKENETIGPIRKFQIYLLRNVLLTTHKSFVRPHLDYGDVTWEADLGLLQHQRWSTLW